MSTDKKKHKGKVKTHLKKKRKKSNRHKKKR